MTKLLATVVAFATSLFVFTANAQTNSRLQFPQNKLTAEITWEQGPFNGKESKFLLFFRDLTTGQPTDSTAAVYVDLWMPSMGHGSSPVEVRQATDEAGRPLVGVFRVTRVFFIMPGDWEIRIGVQGAAGAREDAALSLDIEGDDHGSGHGHGGHH